MGGVDRTSSLLTYLVGLSHGPGCSLSAGSEQIRQDWCKPPVSFRRTLSGARHSSQVVAALFQAFTGLPKHFFGSIQVSVLQLRTGRYPLRQANQI
jgi:hypothetical protein